LDGESLTLGEEETVRADVSFLTKMPSVVASTR